MRVTDRHDTADKSIRGNRGLIYSSAGRPLAVCWPCLSGSADPVKQGVTLVHKCGTHKYGFHITHNHKLPASQREESRNCYYTFEYLPRSIHKNYCANLCVYASYINSLGMFYRRLLNMLRVYKPERLPDRLTGQIREPKAHRNNRRNRVKAL